MDVKFVSASGDKKIEDSTINNTNALLTKEEAQTTTSTQVSSGPMGDAPQKRPLEDGEEPGPKKLAIQPQQFNVQNSASGMNSSSAMSDTMRLPDDLVGLIIGRGGENIMRMQRETGCRIQITQSIPGTKERPCTLSGTPEQIEVCKNMLHEIISRSKAGTLGNNFNLNSSLGMGDAGAEKSCEIQIPPDKCGLIIGKGGETIKMLQQSLGVKMLLIQDSTENVGTSKPLRISGPQANVDNAMNAVHQMMAQRDQQIAQQKMERDGMDGMGMPGMFGDELSKSLVPVPKAAVGVVIGKGGDMINQIQTVTGTRIQFKPEDPMLPDRMCSVMGQKEGVDSAVRRIHEIIQNVQERDGVSMGNRGGPPAGMGGFGHWEGPNMGHRGMGGMATEEHLVPANKTGLVIGKGGETIKQINMQSGAHAEIQKNPPPGSDLNYKTFLIKGTAEQIKLCRHLIQEKVDAGPGGMGQALGGIGLRAGYGPPPPQAGYGGLPPTQYPGQTQLPPAQPTQQAYGQAQQPWGSQFTQWTPPAVTTPQQNGADPTKAASDQSNTAAWQNYLQLYNQAQAQQAQAAFQAQPASVPTPVNSAQPAQPDYSKQWDEYLKQAAAAVTPQLTATASVVAQAAAVPQAAVQPATTTAQATADYTAQWAEYYRQYYSAAQQQQQQQQYAVAAAAAAAAQAPTQT